jgi:hypothetical protein
MVLAASLLNDITAKYVFFIIAIGGMHGLWRVPSGSNRDSVKAALQPGWA